MDSWKYTNISGEKNVWLSQELDYPIEGHNCRSKLTGCEIKPPILNVENYPLISNTQALDRLDFMDLGFADDIRKSYSISSEPSGEVFSDEIGTDYHPQLGEERESTDFMQSNNNQDFSLVDLKLGNLSNSMIPRNSELSKSDVPESSIMANSSGKKARPANLGVRSPSCQVLGCNKDLGSFKSYYKRHKVCDVHTKTPKVIVDGIEQRFCQQCSRFHLLNEFDDIKRSCRRRLAAHNKRRRRPQLTSESGSGMIDFSSSLTFPEGIPNVLLGTSKYKDYEQEDSMKISTYHPQQKMDKIHTNNTKPTIQNLPNIQQTNSALSLLSAPSQSIPNTLLETTTSLLNNNGCHANPIIPQCGTHLRGIYEADVDGPHNTTLLNYPSNGGGGGGGDGGVHIKGRGIILDLLQLSSHLERVQHQRNLNENEGG